MMLGLPGLLSRLVWLVLLALLPPLSLLTWDILQKTRPDLTLMALLGLAALGLGLGMAWWLGQRLMADVAGAQRKLKEAQDFTNAQEQVLTLIAGGAPLAQSLAAIVSLTEKNSPGSLCSILLVQGTQLRHGAAPSLPDAFVQAISRMPILEGAGACGTAAFRRERVVVEDVRVDPLMADYRYLLITHDLLACWSTPVTASDGVVLATFAVYRHSPGGPQAKDLDSMAIATRLARIALERARAEAGLVSSEARFREMADNIDEVFYNRDARTGRVLYISPCYQNIWGRSCQSLYADPASYIDAVVPEDRHMLELADQRNKGGLQAEVEYRISSTDGQERWIADHSWPVMSPAGVLERVVGTALDITQRKLADLKLARTNRALEMLSRSSIAVKRIADEASLLSEVCRVAVDVGNYRMAWVGFAQDDEAHSITPAVHAGHEDGYLSVIRLGWSALDVNGRGPAGQAIRSGQPRYSDDISCADNHFYLPEAALERGYRSAVCLPLRGAERSFGLLFLYSSQTHAFNPEELRLLQELADNLAFGIVSLREQAARQRAQDAARLAQEQVREQASLLDRARDAIIVRNLDRSIRFWNKGAERMYGWTAAEVLGTTMDDRMYPSPQVLERAMAAVVAKGGDWTSELEQVARDGSTVLVEARWTVVRDEAGQVNGVLGINTDIRERTRARQEIMQLNASLEERVSQRTAQLEFANEQLEAFSYSVSHDLRSPLSSIDGFSNLLEKALEKTPDTALAGRHRHYLARIRSGVSHMGGLIDAMLALAQISRSQVRWEQVDLSAQAEALLAGYQERAPGRPTRIDVKPGMVMMGDSRLLNIVLDNLLGNAWKFSAAAPCTDISFDCKLVVNEAGAKETVFAVRDKGAGFDMAYADKLFGVFQRLHTASEFTGTGIGLTTVQRVILRHGGRVWAESEPGKGATFYFTLGDASL